MMKRNMNGMAVVHNDQVSWIDIGDGRQGRCIFRHSLESFLEDPAAAENLDRIQKGNYHSLCIVPDHWFGIETFAFRSKRAGLIEPFLERRLASAHPEKTSIGQFFNYQTVSSIENGDSVSAYYLYDDQAFALYSALKDIHLAPRWITSPGFLWTEALAGIVDGFNRDGTLLIHLNTDECLLYFFFSGQYLFSRYVVVPEIGESLDAVAYEINQSLYLFSQKTKSDLRRCYLFSALPVPIDSLSDTLGRDVVRIDSLLETRQTITIDELPFLNGLLSTRELRSQAEAFSVTHRKVRRGLTWEPVQRTALVVGMLLLLFLIGDNIFLSRLIQNEQENRRLLRLSQSADGMPLSEYAVTLDRVLQRSTRLTSSDVIHRLETGFPEAVRIREMTCDFDSQPSLVLDAEVKAASVAELTQVLSGLVARLKNNLPISGEFSINDIQVRRNGTADGPDAGPYLITLRVGLA